MSTQVRKRRSGRQACFALRVAGSAGQVVCGQRGWQRKVRGARSVRVVEERIAVYEISVNDEAKGAVFQILKDIRTSKRPCDRQRGILGG